MERINFTGGDEMGLPLCEFGGKITILSDGNILSIEWVTFEGRAWVVPQWHVSPDKQFLRPVRIIAPRFAQGIAPPAGPDILQIFGQMQLPQTLLEQGVIPPDIAPVVEVRENPELAVRNPDVLN